MVTQASKNVKFVAYLRMMGIHPDRVERMARGRAKYRFNMPDEKWAQLKQEYDRSDFIRYAQNLDAVVDMAF
jgi:hypothetical protein